MKSNKKPIFLTDVDGVLLDWVRIFGEHAESKGFELKQNLPTTWSMKEWFDADEKTIRELITELNTSKKFADIPAFPDAQKIIPIIAEKFDIVAITCCSKESIVVQRRIENLENQFDVKFKEIHCLNYTESKNDLLKTYHPTMWIEDRFEGAVSGIETGHTSILLNRTYNTKQDHPEIVRADDWHHILEIINFNKIK